MKAKYSVLESEKEWDGEAQAKSRGELLKKIAVETGVSSSSKIIDKKDYVQFANIKRIVIVCIE